MILGVTGGAGFIGLNFVKLALELGYEVIVFDSFTYASNKEELLRLQPTRIHEGDLRDRSEVKQFVDSVDLVVHFAAETHNDNSLSDPELFYEVNVMGTLNLVQAIRSSSKRLHHVSTDEVFGDLELEGNDKFTESSPYRPSSPYSSSKASSDHMVRSWVRSFGLSATISNCSNNFGPYQHSEKFIPSVIQSCMSGKKPRIYGDGSNVRDWIHVIDHVHGIMSIIENGEVGETYLLGANCQRSNMQILAIVLEHLGLPSDFYELVEDRPGHDRRYAIDATKSIIELGWEPSPTPFEAKLSETIDWYLRHE